jgi:hypothetical protein
MNSNFIYDWGETVRVVMTAPEELRPGQVCSVCGMREMEGTNLYLVEFQNGDSLEVPENNLETMTDE